jgi:hypothetical protein
MSPPPTTFVPADDNLFPPLAHGGAWLALGIAACVLGIALVAWMLDAPADPIAKAHDAELLVQREYLAEIDAVQQRFADRQIDERQLHHELSRTVRRFATEHGAPGALAMTASDLRAAGLDEVSDVVAGYQPPQFMSTPRCDPDASVAIARQLVLAIGERGPQGSAGSERW